MKMCIGCGKKIPKIRLEALPETNTCVKCSVEQNRKVITVWNDGVPEVVPVSEDDFERFNELDQIGGRLDKLNKLK